MRISNKNDKFCHKNIVNYYYVVDACCLLKRGDGEEGIGRH